MNYMKTTISVKGKSCKQLRLFQILAVGTISCKLFYIGNIFTARFTIQIYGSNFTIDRVQHNALHRVCNINRIVPLQQLQ